MQTRDIFFHNSLAQWEECDTLSLPFLPSQTNTQLWQFLSTQHTETPPQAPAPPALSPPLKLLQSNQAPWS